MAIEPSSAFTKLASSKKVCVLNLHDQPYDEDFKGEKIIVPPNGQRELYMPLWKARKFLASCAYPPAMDYTGELIRGGRVKMLRVADLTEEERIRLGELTPDELEAAQKRAEAKAGLFCGMCDFEAKDAKGLKIHVTRTHPEVTAVE